MPEIVRWFVIFLLVLGMSVSTFFCALSRAEGQRKRFHSAVSMVGDIAIFIALMSAIGVLVTAIGSVLYGVSLVLLPHSLWPFACAILAFFMFALLGREE